MSDAAFLLWARRRLMLPIVPSVAGKCNLCGQCIDDNGEHFIKCTGLGRGPAHYGVKKATIRSLTEITKSMGGTQIKDEPGLWDYAKESSASNVEAEGVPTTTTTPRSKKKVKKAAEKPRADIGVYNRIKKTTVLIDVRTCSMLVPTSIKDIGQTVVKGEEAKMEQYSTLYSFPEGVTFIPFAIDSLGRWGDGFTTYLKLLCKSATDSNLGRYNRLITRARDWIAIANARDIGERLARGLEECLSPEAQMAVARKSC
jgi:hypothetical protein